MIVKVLAILTNNFSSSIGFLHPDLKKFSAVVVRLILLLALPELKIPTGQKQRVIITIRKLL